MVMLGLILAVQLQKLTNAMRSKQAEEVKELNDLYSDIASGIAGEFTSAFKSIIDGEGCSSCRS